MSTRNLILLIIVMVVVVAAVIGFLYFGQEPTVPTESPGTNFISNFNPFGTSTPAPVTPPPAPVDVTGFEPDIVTEIPTGKLMKVSSMPVAGYTVFSKERLKDMPVVVSIISPTPYNFGTTTLKKGSTGEEVKEIQRFLNETLALSLELDGILDEEITVEIKKWQSGRGLVSDGIVGAKTKALMYSSVNQITQNSEPTPPPTEFMPALRYVDKATGNIYQTFADKIDERKFSGTTIPKVYEAYFGNQGESVVMRYLKTDGRTIETFVGSLPKELLGADSSLNNEVKGSFLPNGVRDVSLSPNATGIFYLFSSGESIIGTTLNFLNNKKIQVFDSPFTEWLSWWPNSNLVTLTTKPSAGVPGHMYILNIISKSFIRILGDINGLTTLASPNGKLILYGNNNLSLNIYHTDTRNTDPLSIRTLSEKCVWGKSDDFIYCAVPKSIPAGEYPDAWYQGEVSFSDQLWKINTANGNATLVLDPGSVMTGEEIDGIKLSLDEGENHLFFVNKKDSYLWKLDMK